MSPMSLIGEDKNGLKWYFADNHFTNPGVYFWDGKENIHVHDKIRQLETELTAMTKAAEGLAEQLRITDDESKAVRLALAEFERDKATTHDRLTTIATNLARALRNIELGKPGAAEGAEEALREFDKLLKP